MPKTGYEDSDVAFSTTDFSSHFDDAYGDDLVQIQVMSLPADGTLELNGSPVTPDQEILAADLDNLSFTPDAEWNGFNSFGWNGSDGIAYAASAAAVNITLEPVNDRPSFTGGADQVANEDAGAQAAPGWATDISAGPDDEVGQVLTFTVETDAGAFFAVQPAIDSTSGDLSYTSADDANGSATITVTLVDDGGTGNGGTDTSLPQTFTITINPVNDAPSFTRGDDQVVDEDAGAQIGSTWATDILAGPDDESGQGLVFTVIADNNALFAVPPAISPFTGDLTYTPADDLYGSATATVTLMDNGGTDNGGMDTSLPQTFTITVDPVNDAPVVSDLDKTGSMNTDTAFATTDFASHFSDVDGDDLVQIQVTSLPAHGTLKLNGTPIVENQEIPAADLGALTFAPDTDWFGSTSFGWNGSDGIAYAASDAAANISVLEPYRVFLPVAMRNASAP